MTNYWCCRAAFGNHEDSCQNYAALLSSVNQKYPEYPVEIMACSDDTHVICVCIFAVPKEKRSEVKSAIRKIGRDLFVDGEYLVLPMVKTVEVTRQYYPQHLTCSRSNGKVERLEE